MFNNYLCIIFIKNLSKLNQFIIFEIIPILLFCLLGSYFIINTNNFFAIYLTIELQSLALYVLIGIKNYSNLSIEAAFKYYILGSFASCLILFGIFIIYSVTGNTSFYAVALCCSLNFYNINYILGISVGFLFITVGFLFKLGVAPFHY